MATLVVKFVSATQVDILRAKIKLQHASGSPNRSGHARLWDRRRPIFSQSTPGRLCLNSGFSGFGLESAFLPAADSLDHACPPWIIAAHHPGASTRIFRMYAGPRLVIRPLWSIVADSRITAVSSSPSAT